MTELTETSGPESTQPDTAEAGRALPEEPRALSDLADRIRSLEKQFESVLPHLVTALKRENAVEGLLSRLDKAEQAVVAQQAFPLALAVMKAVHDIRRLDLDANLKTAFAADLVDALERQGFIEFDPTGEHFDPARDQALAVDSGSDSTGVVVETFATGFTLGDQIVLKAMVRVGAQETSTEDQPH